MRALLLATLLLASCGKKNTDPPIGLSVLSTGAGEEKHLLRYAAQKGTAYQVVMTMEMDLGVGLKPPPTSFTMEIKVTDVSPDGDISYDFRFVDITIEGTETPDALKKVMDMSGSAVVDSRGVNKAGRIKLGDDAPAQVKAMMGKFEEQLRQLSCPFPEEPVAIGAKWALTQNVETDAFGLKQTGTFELVEFNDNRGKLKLNLKQWAEDEEMKGLPGGMKATLVSLESTGTGELEFDLSKPVPVRSSLQISSDIHVRVKDQTHRQKIGIKITIAEKQ